MESQDKAFKKVGKYLYDPTSEPLVKTKFGDVYKGYDGKGAEAPVLITVVPKTVLNTAEKENMFNAGLAALATISTLKLEQTLRLKESNKSTNNYYLVTEAHNGKTLESIIQEKQKLSEEFVLDIIKRVAQVFDSVEKQEIKDEGNSLLLLHRNIKPKNIVFHNDKAKLTGFGFSQLIKKGASSTQGFAGTPLYMSPQLLSMVAYTNKSDVWSLGIVAYTAFCGKKPWVAENERLLLQTIKVTPLVIPEDVSKETSDLLKQMLQFDEEKRIDWKDILDHPALNTKEKLVAD